MVNTQKAQIENLKKEKTFEEIKALFENRSYFVRSQFLDQYHFKDNFKDYYIDFIVKNSLYIKNDNYLSDLVCLTIELNLFDSRIIETWYQLLNKSTSVVVKVCILDYFNFCPSKKLPSEYIETLSKMSKDNLRKILKNQIYVNLLSLDEKNEMHKILLLNSLENTKDSRSIIRTISCLNRFKSKKLISEIKKKILSLDLNFTNRKNRLYIINKVTN